MTDGFPTDTAPPFGTRYRSAAEVAAELGYLGTRGFLRRWRNFGLPEFKSGRAVMLEAGDVRKFIEYYTVQQRTTPAHSDGGA